MKKTLVLALLTLAPIASQAALVQLQYNSTTLAPITGYPNLPAGSGLSITILADNGSGVESSTWDNTSITSITYQVGTGPDAFVYTFDTSHPDFVWGYVNGFYTTDASGDVSLTPEAWVGFMTGGPQFWLNGINHIYMYDNVNIEDLNVSDNREPSSWTATVVPEPSAALLGSLGAIALLRRRRR